MKKVHINEAAHFRASDEGFGWITEGRAALVVGVSMDAGNGLLDYARDHGLQMVVVDPKRPAFLHAQDWYVRGLADSVLPNLSNLLATDTKRE